MKKTILICSCLCLLAVVAFAKTEDDTSVARPYVAYGQGPSGIVPILVASDGTISIH